MKIIKLGKYVFHFVVSIYNMVSNVVQCYGQYGVIFCIITLLPSWRTCRSVYSEEVSNIFEILYAHFNNQSFKYSY